jgi:hypothetical protein
MTQALYAHMNNKIKKKKTLSAKPGTAKKQKEVEIVSFTS